MEQNAVVYIGSLEQTNVNLQLGQAQVNAGFSITFSTRPVYPSKNCTTT